MPLEQVIEPVQAPSSAPPEVQQPASPSAQVNPVTPAPPDDLSVIDWAKANGYDLSGHQNDEAALRHLLDMSRSYPQLQQLARYGQEVLPQWERYQQWLQSGAQPQQQVQPAAQPKGPWSPPTSQGEVEKLLARWYTRDPQNGIQPRPDAPPSVVQKVSEYQQYVSDFETQLRHDPMAALKPFVQQQAKELFQQEYQQREVQRQAQEVVQRHASWMFQPDQNGIPQYGRYTPEGHRFWQYVQRLEQSGVKDVSQQEFWALSMVQRDMFEAKQQQQTQQTQPPPQRSNPQQPSRAVRQPSVTPPTPAVPRGAMSLEQMALQNIRAAGINVG